MGAAKFNLRNPAVKRIMQEIKEMQAEKSPDFIADALEDDIFEWHFVVRGPPDTEFEGGIYHGRILLPAEYPFKPPSFMMLTPNGRFQTGVKICLSISSHHPEHWQPSWSVRTALTALIAFMPTPGQGALGSVDFTKEERKQLALKSRSEEPKFGSPARQQVINDMHQRMLELQQQAATSSSSNNSKNPAEGDEAASVAPGSPTVSAAQQLPRTVSPDVCPDGGDQDSSRQQQQKQAQQQHKQPGGTFTALKQDQQVQQKPTVFSGTAGDVLQEPSSASTTAQQGAGVNQQQLQFQRAALLAAGSRPNDLGDKGLAFLAVVLSVAIAAVLLKKVMTAMNGGYELFVEM